jgi:hypothetical protein
MNVEIRAAIGERNVGAKPDLKRGTHLFCEYSAVQSWIA